MCGLVAASLLVLVQLVLARQMVGHVHAFHRGTTLGEWRSGGLPPRLQHQRVELIVGRWRESSAARHGWIVCYWQFVIWTRQLGLLAITSVSSMVLDQLDPSLATHDATRTTVKWTMVSLATTTLLVALAGQQCVRPFARSIDNALESFLLVEGIILLLLGGVYDHLLSSVSLQQGVGALSAMEALLLCVLVCGLLGSALFAVWDACRHRAASASAVLAELEDRLTRPIRECLLDGSIRLLRCEWLLSTESEAELGRSASGDALLQRRQELPEAAFFTPSEAAALLDRADRSILVLSYRWLTAAHPDPFGSTLNEVRRYLKSVDDVGEIALFVECARVVRVAVLRTPHTNTHKHTRSAHGALAACTQSSRASPLRCVPAALRPCRKRTATASARRKRPQSSSARCR